MPGDDELRHRCKPGPATNSTHLEQWHLRSSFPGISKWPHLAQKNGPIRERNHRHELVAYDTIRAPKYSLLHRWHSRWQKRLETEGTKTRVLKEPSENDADRAEC